MGIHAGRRPPLVRLAHLTLPLTRSGSPMSSTREKLLNHPRRTIPVTLATGDVVEARPLSLVARQKVVKECTVDGEVATDRLIPAIVIACLYDPATGEPLFTIGDRDAIGEMPAEVVDPMWTAAAELNGLAPDAKEQAEKN